MRIAEQAEARKGGRTGRGGRSHLVNVRFRTEQGKARGEREQEEKTHSAKLRFQRREQKQVRPPAAQHSFPGKREQKYLSR